MSSRQGLVRGSQRSQLTRQHSPVGYLWRQYGYRKLLLCRSKSRHVRDQEIIIMIMGLYNIDPRQPKGISIRSPSLSKIFLPADRREQLVA